MDLFVDAFERSPHALVRTEGERHIIRYANSAFCRLCGKDEERIITRPFASAVPANSEDGYAPLLEKAFRESIVQRGENLKQTDSMGRTVYWSYVTWPVLNEDLSVRGLMIEVTDTTARVVAAEQDARTATDMRDVNAALIQAGLERAERAEAAERELREHQAEIEALNQRLQRAMRES